MYRIFMQYQATDLNISMLCVNKKNHFNIISLHVAISIPRFHASEKEKSVVEQKLHPSKCGVEMNACAYIAASEKDLRKHAYAISVVFQNTVCDRRISSIYSSELPRTREYTFVLNTLAAQKLVSKIVKNDRHQ